LQERTTYFQDAVLASPQGLHKLLIGRQVIDVAWMAFPRRDPRLESLEQDRVIGGAVDLKRSIHRFVSRLHFYQMIVEECRVFDSGSTVPHDVKVSWDIPFELAFLMDLNPLRRRTLSISWLRSALTAV
jgi:hypothetical protein